MEPMMIVRAVVGLILIAGAGYFALRRVWFLYTLIRSGQPAVGRTDQVPARVETQFTEVLGQRKLLKWSVPGTARPVLRGLRHCTDRHDLKEICR